MLDLVEEAGVMLVIWKTGVHTENPERSQIGSSGRWDGPWARSRETHPGPHSDWFWTKEISGGGVLLDMGCHCIEISRSYIGKDIKPVEVMCWTDTLVKPIEAEDNALGWVRYENGAVGQFEVS
jgi:predicted dehydrogenase